MLAASSPELFVGRHVLLRRCVPRYPPSALFRLTAHIGVFLFVAMQFSRFFYWILTQQSCALDATLLKEIFVFALRFSTDAFA